MTKLSSEVSSQLSGIVEPGVALGVTALHRAQGDGVAVYSVVGREAAHVALERPA